MKKHGALAISAHGCIREFESYTVPKDINLIFVSPPGCFTYLHQLRKLLESKESVKKLFDPSISSVHGYLIDRVQGGTKISNMTFQFLHNVDLMGVYAVPLQSKGILGYTSEKTYKGNSYEKLAGLMHVYDLLNINSLQNNTSSPAEISLKALLEYLGPGTYIIASCRAPCSSRVGSLISGVSRKLSFLKTSMAQNEDRFRATLPEHLQKNWNAVPILGHNGMRRGHNKNKMLSLVKQQFNMAWKSPTSPIATSSLATRYAVSGPTRGVLLDQVAPSVPDRVVRALRRNKFAEV